ncbi:unnamed protein product [Cuscuta epithymum]|uniref:Piwi domain-containing protein n=1 Tax=Cuscuta epithymum TaxID=186058 RepID=A0AAV0FAS5_9ASTE|nr:unnamed protein product [Cuscuta epithymum]
MHPSTLQAVEGEAVEGEVVTLETNHFPIDFKGKFTIFAYKVSIYPDSAKQHVWEDILMEFHNMRKLEQIGMDFNDKALYSVGAILTVKDYPVTIHEGNKSTAYTVNIEQSWVESVAGKELPSPEFARALDSIMLRFQLKSFKSLGSSLIRNVAYSLGHGVCAVDAFHQNIRRTEKGLCLIIDLLRKPTFESIMVSEFVKLSCSLETLAFPLADAVHSNLERVLKGLWVEIETSCHPSLRGQITSLTRVPINDVVIPGEDKFSDNLKLCSYLWGKYSITPDYPSLPAIELNHDSRQFYMPMEFCRICDSQECFDLTKMQLKKMRTFMLQKPNIIQRTITKILNENYFVHTKQLNISLAIHEEQTRVQARVLPAPWLQYLKHDVVTEIKPMNGKWALDGLSLVDPKKVGPWACIRWKNDSSHIDSFIHDLVRICTALGISFDAKDPDFMTLDHTDDILQHPLLENMSLVIVVVPELHISSDGGELHRILDCNLNIISYVCNLENVVKCKTEYLISIALTMNAKLGGRNILLSRPIPSMGKEATMVFGISRRNKSWGVVGSMDVPGASVYESYYSTMPGGQQLVGMIHSLVKRYFSKNQALPQRLIFFRNGAKEEGLQNLISNEILQIKQFRDQSYNDIKITVVVVDEKSHCRFFHDGGIVRAGTVVDSQICPQDDLNFYLHSGSGVKGTVCATHYRVTCDENLFSADAMKTICHTLCYINAGRTRSHPTVIPLYYAQLVASRARFYWKSSDHGHTYFHVRKQMHFLPDDISTC